MNDTDTPNILTWTLTTDKPHPDKPGKANYEQIRCLVVYRGETLLRLWNCEHLCWDDEEGDDWFCDVDDVTAWMLAPEPPVDTTQCAERYLPLSGISENNP